MAVEIMMTWTPEMDKAIWSGMKANRKAAEIARSLRVTRNAVLGRSYRLRGYRKPYPYRRAKT